MRRSRESAESQLTVSRKYIQQETTRLAQRSAIAASLTTQPLVAYRYLNRGD
jgi:hypothetical protein